MSLTAAQLTTLRNDIANDGALNPLPKNADAALQIAAVYNAIAVPDFFVFRTNVTVAEILNTITWANFTPADAIASDGSNSALWSARSLDCQGKMLNLQTMLTGRTTFDASKITQRSGLNDATTNLPSGVAGANASGGWVNILAILRRQATRAEKLFAVATSGVGTVGTDPLGATTNPALMQFEGNVTGQDVDSARAN